MKFKLEIAAPAVTIVDIDEEWLDAENEGVENLEDRYLIEGATEWIQDNFFDYVDIRVTRVPD